jgi:hypothetical protein
MAEKTEILRINQKNGPQTVEREGRRSLKSKDP